MVARVGHIDLTNEAVGRQMQGRRATIKAHSTRLLPARPYGDEAPATFK